MVPGEILPANDPVTINAGPEPVKVSIRNTGDVPVHLTAHFHVFEANPRLAFDRSRAWGMRLDVAADESVRIESGRTVEVSLVPIGGKRVVYGFNGAVNGALDATDKQAALASLVSRGFLHEPTR